jgi:glycosyltransferase involved in cell wall biosynthesis
LKIDNLEFSIIIPFKFGAKYANECFISLADGFLKTRAEVIVVLDDPSSTELDMLMKAISGLKSHLLLNVITSPGKGISDALNCGIDIARGEYIVRHDIDDLCFSWRGARLSHLSRSKPDFIFGSVVTFPLPFYLSVPNNKEAAISLATIQNPFFHPASAFTRSGMARIGGYRSDFDRLEDYDLWARVLESNMKIVLDSKPHTKYRRHSLQFTRQRKGTEVDEMREVIKTRAKSISKNRNVTRPTKSLLLGLWYLTKDSL